MHANENRQYRHQTVRFWQSHGFCIKYGLSSGGTLKTSIMVGANLNSTQIEKYLSLLLEGGFLETINKEGRRILYKTTERGRHFIEEYKKGTAFLVKERRT